jgi:hypothetical protein
VWIWCAKGLKISFGHFPEAFSMCGILGLIVRRSAPLEQATVRSTRAMAHCRTEDEGTQILPLDSNPSQCMVPDSCRLAILDPRLAGRRLPREIGVPQNTLCPAFRH